jgi:phospholipid/cholesterol/gamma-HCH transport system substrate-binding protein
MENRSHALIAGLFTLLLGLCAVAAVLWFGGKEEATSQYVVVTKKNVGGLSLQGRVRYRGVNVGKVEGIAFDPSDIRSTLINIRIRKDIPITRGTTARLGFQGVTGIAHVLLEDEGKDTALLADGDSGDSGDRIPMQDSQLQELTDVGGDTLRNAREFLGNANQLLNPENRQAIANTLANLEALSGSAREVTAQLQQVLTPENVRLLRSTLARADQTAAEAGPFFAEARTLVARLQSVSEKLELTLGDSSFGGLDGMVPRFNELSAELSANSQQLTRVLQMLEDSPQSLIFGPRRGTPGPGESGFVAPGNTQRGTR